MKRHLLRIGLFILTFAVGFLFAPIRFISLGVGSGSVGPESHCSFSLYYSTHFEQVSSWSCSFDSSISQNQFINRIKADGSLVSSNAKGMLLEHDVPEHGYCSYWIDQNGTRSICSRSLRHVTALERQFIVLNY
jgi:hypothetical protein